MFRTVIIVWISGTDIDTAIVSLCKITSQDALCQNTLGNFASHFLERDLQHHQIMPIVPRNHNAAVYRALIALFHLLYWLLSVLCGFNLLDEIIFQ